MSVAVLESFWDLPGNNRLAQSGASWGGLVDSGFLLKKLAIMSARSE